MGEIAFLELDGETAADVGSTADHGDDTAPPSSDPQRLAEVYRDPESLEARRRCGLALVEAQQAGLPVLTSGIGGALEIVDGSCGVLTAPGNVSALSDALRRLVVDHALRARLSAESRRRADDLCNAPRQIRRIEVLLATALTVPRPVRQRRLKRA